MAVIGERWCSIDVEGWLEMVESAVQTCSASCPKPVFLQRATQASTGWDSRGLTADNTHLLNNGISANSRWKNLQSWNCGGPSLLVDLRTIAVIALRNVNIIKRHSSSKRNVMSQHVIRPLCEYTVR